MAIAPVAAGECAALAALHRASLPYQRWREEDFLAWQAHAGYALYRMQAPGGGVAGYVVVRHVPPEAEIITLVVAPALRRQGIGRALLEHALAARPAQQWFLEVSADNQAAQALYRRCGFAQAGRRRHYYADGSDALVMRRSEGA